MKREPSPTRPEDRDLLDYLVAKAIESFAAARHQSKAEEKKKER